MYKGYVGLLVILITVVIIGWLLVTQMEYLRGFGSVTEQQTMTSTSESLNNENLQKVTSTEEQQSIIQRAKDLQIKNDAQQKEDQKIIDGF
ncbi:hypothetical protein COT94_04440 [Candidatus Falkowbacteria bacterium CG10_big_fil_rev_8_21_14_0_10_37_14]|uniref:Uncharacterized protein n=1 Tax=Candidatus Falkowbacteria bacterium CG10_big_fil_rev_8_21_14_0_10_37_14 TaxID=1974561 RepID=A0A2M6WSR0_9BACT|nr:hypothetical protein [Candidatus Falkowbacteria bacterium]PIT95805.1 MAG: hypothetical protein COT94_04440 [Candidatus Falkowbacteria bacterium CG10_big_fil_rev_8_21_14_0_10_37_14]